MAVAIALAIGAVFALAQILADAAHERKSLTTHAAFVLDFASLPAARAAYRLDGVGAQELAESLLSDPAVVHAVILDDFGEPLAKAAQHEAAARTLVTDFLLGADPIKFERKLYINTDTFVGNLTINIDPAAASPGFEQRTINSILSGLIKSTLLSIMLLVIYQYMVTKRISRLAGKMAPANAEIPGDDVGDELDQLEQRFHDWSRKLQMTARRAEQANNAKTIFLASMSHEMRTPLNAVIGYAEMLEMGIGLDEPNKRAYYLKSIVSAGRQLNVLLGDILDFSKIEAGTLDFNLERILLSEVVQENANLIQDMVGEKGLKLEIKIGACAAVVGDRSRLRQVILNLVSNAVKYNRPSGSVRIGCNDDNPGRIRLFVADTGIGIPKDQLETLFSDFVRGNHHQQDIPGAGLGLAISKLLTEGMGGTIGCDSALGEGSTFWIELPVEPVVPAPTEPAAPTEKLGQ